MSSFFITGTDTNVGKTIVTRAIMQALQKAGIKVVGYKPIAFGQDEPIYSLKSLQEESDYETKDNSDVLTLMNSTSENVTYEEVNSYTFLHTIPILTEESQRVKIEKLNADLARLSAKYSSVAVEGAFGWLTPINKDYSFADWVAEHNMPTIVVVGIKEGCINHALLTVQSILSKNLPLLGWVANRINPGLGHYAEIIETLKQKIDAPLLGEIAYIHRPEEQDLSHFIRFHKNRRLSKLTKPSLTITLLSEYGRYLNRRLQILPLELITLHPLPLRSLYLLTRKWLFAPPPLCG